VAFENIQPAQTSLGSSVTLEQLAHDPYPLFQQLLTHEPVSWCPDINMWLVTRYVNVVNILKDWERFSLEDDHSQIAATIGPMMLSTDGAHHKRQRVPFATPFRPKPLRRSYSNIIAQIANNAIDALPESNKFDLDKAFSDEVALLTVATVLGFPVEDRETFVELYEHMAMGVGNFRKEASIQAIADQAMTEFHRYVIALVERLKKEPNDSILSQMVHSADSNLTNDEIVSNTAITFFGGLETTASLLSNSIWCFLTEGVNINELITHPAKCANAVEEVLRWEAPVQTAHRLVKQDVVLHGRTLKAGDMVQTMLSGANRDPRIFENPNTFDIERVNANKHLSFARGPHFCFGAPLARMEATIGLPILFGRLRNLRLDSAHPTKPTGHEFRSPETLFCKWD
jgi:cytochrome P450